MTKLVCPNCGVHTAFFPARVFGQGILSDESNDKRTVYGNVEISAIVPYAQPYGEDGYAILVCASCGELFVVRKEIYSDKDHPAWMVVYPIQHKAAAEEIPEPIKSIFVEASLCFAVDAYRACVSTCLIALENLWRDKEASGLNQLKEKGIISDRLHQRATEIRLWANIGKHELIVDPISKDDAEELLGYLELLLHEVYVEPKRLDSLTKKRKELEKKD